MADYFVPLDSKAYSPKGVRDLFEQAVKDEGDDIAAVLKNKHKYKNLLELWYASFLALAINKWLSRKYYMYSPASDPPDVLFLDQENSEAFPVEIIELYFHGESKFDGNYKKLADTLWKKKGKISFDKCHLLIVSRLSEANFDVVKLAEELKDFKWRFERIWFAIYTSSSVTWRFFDIYPRESDPMPNIPFSTEDRGDMKYFY
jgi:hypothetical protein